MVKKAVIQVRDTMIRTLQENGIDYICITDIARQKNPVEPKDVVKNWMRVKNTLEYLGLWEKLNNLNFRRCVKMHTFFFYAQNPDFHKQGLCYYLKILYL